METTNNNWSSWIEKIQKYTKPNPIISWWQIASSFIPYFGIWVLMVYSLNVSYWITLGLSVVAAGFLMRIFIIFHDCGHGSFFQSNLLNRMVGIVAGILAFTPYHKWHYQHMVHHQTMGNLDKRGVGDVMTLTVEEFKKRSAKSKFFYRVYRNPFIIFLVSPIILFIVLNRLPSKKLSPRINLYTHLTTLGIIALIILLSLWIGFKPFLLVQLPIIYFATNFGVWLFYIQHQFENVVWERDETWDYSQMAMKGSSYLKLPKVLQWFSGNIGFHHIHHLSPKIPNYYLERCFKENALFQKEPITFLSSFKTIRQHLWDEENRKLLGFREALGKKKV